MTPILTLVGTELFCTLSSYFSQLGGNKLKNKNFLKGKNQKLN